MRKTLFWLGLILSVLSTIVISSCALWVILNASALYADYPDQADAKWGQDWTRSLAQFVLCMVPLNIAIAVSLYAYLTKKKHTPASDTATWLLLIAPIPIIIITAVTVLWVMSLPILAMSFLFPYMAVAILCKRGRKETN